MSSSRLGLLLVVGIFLTACLLGQTSCEHGHSHDEPASYKYSREANEDSILTEEEWKEQLLSQNGHGHSHGGDGHSHGGHGHSHGGHGHSHGGHGHSHGPPQKEPSKKQREQNRERLHKIWDEDDNEEEASGRNVWFQAIGATLLISAAPFVILFFIPLDNSDEKRWLLKIFLSFASGGLLGDAMLHLIPHAMMATEMSAEGHGHGHSHSHDEGHVHDMSVGLGVLSGIVAFLCVEKIVRIMNGSSGGHGHSHHHGSVAPSEAQKSKQSDQPSGEDRLEDKSSGRADEKDDGAEGKNLDEVKKRKKKKDKDDSSDEKKKKPEGENAGSKIDVSGFLNLFADCFHNFTDGLAIGASFAAGENVGKITTLTILLHEVPHEIGDYAILIKSGVPPMKAIMLQLLTAVGALTGCVVSLFAHGDSALGAKSSAFILPFTAGGFIYIATVSVIPDLLDGKTTLKQSMLEIVALLTGIGMMVVIAQFE